MVKFVVVLVMTFLAGAGVAHAVTIQTTDTSHPWQQWSDTAQVPTYAGVLPVTVAPDYFDCGGFTQAQGCTSITPTVDGTTGNVIGPPTVTTELDGGTDPWSARQALYHELGQIFWAEYMTPADETQFMQIVGLAGDSGDWGNWDYSHVTNGVTMTFAPFEWFAEGYRYCAEYGVNQPLRVSDEEGLGYPGDQASFAPQQRQVCQLIDRVGLDNGITTPTQAAAPIARIPRQLRTRLVTVRPHRLRGSGFTWGTKEMRLLSKQSLSRRDGAAGRSQSRTMP